MEGIKIRLLSWEDGAEVEHDMEVTDRWRLHAAHEVHVTIAQCTVRLKQEPHSLNATRMGVGACLWEGELLLAQYLGSLPSHRFIGARCIELGSGPGLVGLFLAKLGATVIISDIAKVLPLIQLNVDLNDLDAAKRRGAPGGSAEVAELEWGSEGYEARVASLAHPAPDFVVAADCVYIDNEGASPSTEHFVRTCVGLCGPRTRCLVSFELRSSEVKATFLREANAQFAKVVRVPVSALPKGCRVEHIELYELSTSSMR